jgi:hypothetical protein
LLRETSSPRAAVFVLLSLAGFVAANAFLQYLVTGRFLDFSAASYRQAMSCSLGRMLLEPLSIFHYPWMIAVLALLVGLVIFLPIMVAVLYRTWISMIFVLAVAVVGHAPLLAAVLACGCLAASQTRLRSDFPFLSLLIGLAPSALYVYLFAYLNLPVLAPLQRFALYVPLTLALGLAVLAGAVALLLARLTRFRAGVTWPVLTVLLVLPILIFQAKVGEDELDYCLLIEQFQVGSELQPGSAETAQLERRLSKRLPASAPASWPSSAAASAPWPELLQEAQAQLERRRKAIQAGCDEFLRGHADSNRAPAVLWIRATALDLTVNLEAFARGHLEYDAARPGTQSLSAWNELNDRFPGSPQAMVARHRLGVLALCEPRPRVRMAYDHLHPAQEILRKYLAHFAEPLVEGGFSSAFSPLESLPGREYYRNVLQEIDHTLWRMQAGNVLDGPPENVQAFAEYMRRWPFKPANQEELLNLAQQFEQTPLGEDFRLQAVMAAGPELARALRLREIRPDSVAAIQANYELGRLALRLADTPGWKENGLRPAAEYFQAVVAAQENPWTASASQHLTRLTAPRPAPKEEPLPDSSP